MDELTRRVPVQLENGMIAYVEAADLGGRHDVGEGLQNRFDDAMGAVRQMSSQIYDTMAALAPQRFEVELGFELGVESGHLTAFLVKGTGKANLKVTLEWKSG
jgi:hypothetical protein